MTIGGTEIQQHINETANKGKKTTDRTLQISKFPTHIKTHLIKPFITPVLLYPVITTLTTSKTSQNKLKSPEQSPTFRTK